MTKEAIVKKTAAIGLVLFFALTAVAKQPAFPEAEGPGKWAMGGRGGGVYEVTTLADYNPGYPDYEAPIAGSLRAAVEASGARTVVFRISGTIHLKYKLKITNPYLTIAGQTAPGDGICIARYPVVVMADHVIIRYIRSRLSNNASEEGDVQYDGPEGEGGYDSFAIVRGRNIIIDHCSASWGIDETISCGVASSRTPPSDHPGNVTVQWCIISESLDCAGRWDGCHGYGSLIKEGYGNEITFHHNFYAHHSDRNPYPGNYNSPASDPAGLIFNFCNNVIYDWGRTCAGYNNQVAPPYDSVTKMNFIGNYYKQKPNSTGGNYAFSENLPSSRGYFSGNWMNTGYPTNPWSLVVFSGSTGSFKQSSPIPVSEQIAIEDAQTAYERVLAGAGATLPKRDVVDQRVINDVINGTGRIIDDESEVGGWPLLVSKPTPLDSDHDGMPDMWEIARGLNSNNLGDGNWDRDGDGYTNLEEYLNYLVSRGYITPDFDDDCETDMLDYAFFANHWLRADCNESNNWCDSTDFDWDGETNLNDLAVVAENWLKGVVGTTYYVATDGNDANPGMSELPWRTIQKAADTMVAGDTVIVRPGTYNEQVTAVNSGSSSDCGTGGLPITYLADPSGDVIVNAAGNNCGFLVEDKIWIIIDGFKITGSDEDGVKINVDGSGYITVSNCQIYGNNDDGIEVLERDRVTIENCLFYGNVGAGIRTIYTSSMLQVDKCVMYGNDYGLTLSGDSTVRNCIITNNATGVEAEAQSIITYCDVWNNTSNYIGQVSAGTGCISSDPLFANPPTDFQLSTGSPCIGTGSNGDDMGYSY